MISFKIGEWREISALFFVNFICSLFVNFNPMD
nr:MAG TPA: hypothetical protein [Caudoviricetes sp.]